MPSTALLREVLRPVALRYGTKVVVDTSSEVTGAG